MALTFEKLSSYYIASTRKEFTAVAATNILTCSGHGLADGDIIRAFISIGSSSGHLPAPMLPLKNYYVKYINSNTFYLSLTSGGATLDITDAGSSPGYKFSLYRSAEYKAFTAATSDIITCTGHGLIEGDIIVVDSNTTLPAPLTADTEYYVKYINANTFYLSLTSGGATIDITNTGTGAHWWQRRTTYDTIKRGSLITNLTRAGKAILLNVTRLSAELGDVIRIEYLKISGSFLNLDECTTSDGGFFSLFETPSLTTLDTIVVNGIDSTDTTNTLDGDIDAITTTVRYSVTGDVINSGRYILIDSEWMYVLVAPGAILTVERAMFGTTAASHTSGAAVYILEEDLPRAIYDEDVAQGWGYCSISDGKFQTSCPIILGRPDQTSPTLLLTTLDRWVCDRLYITGISAYPTIVQSGIGWVDAGLGVYSGFYFNGSNISSVLMKLFENAVLNLFGGTLYLSAYDEYSFYGDMNVMASAINSVSPEIAPAFKNIGACKMYRSWINNSQVTASSSRLDWSSVWENFKISQAAVVFSNVAGTALFRNLEVVELSYSQGIYAASSEGVKTFIDCDINETTIDESSTVLTIHKKTVSVVCQTPENLPIPGVRIKIYDKNKVKISDTLTDTSGIMATQEITYKYLDNDYATMIDNNPFKFVVTKPGWKDKNFTTDIYDPILYNFIMENSELTENEN